MASMAMRPCLSSASRKKGIHSAELSANFAGSKFLLSGPSAPARPARGPEVKPMRSVDMAARPE